MAEGHWRTDMPGSLNARACVAMIGAGAPCALGPVLDGLGAEKSHRWMAERIWGEESVAEEWSSENWMRAPGRHWIPKARALADGGWRDHLVPCHVPEPWRAAPTAGPDAGRPGVSGKIALRHKPPGAYRRRRIMGNVPAIRGIAVDKRGQEFD